jgi:renalase
MQDVLIIGAGVAGLTAARDLAKAGRDVLVLEKSRGLSGRSSTRTANGSRVDHGAQYFTARDARFQQQVDEWLEQGHLKIWSHGFHRLTTEGLVAPTQGNPRYIFPQGMNTIGKLLGEGLKVRTETKVTSVSKQGNVWLVSSEGETFEAKTVILNMPAEQALTLCAFELGEVKQQLEQVTMEPSFALMLGYDKTFLPEWQGILVETSETISWISHDSTKRKDPKETILVVHSTPQFARAHFEEPPESIKEKLLSALPSSLLPPPYAFAQPSYTSLLWSNLHRWKYALASKFLDAKFLQDDSLFVCGDWCGGARLEAAYMSGLALAERLTELP